MNPKNFRRVSEQEVLVIEQVLMRLGNIARGCEIRRLANLKADYGGWKTWEALQILKARKSVGYSKIGGAAWYFKLPQAA